MIITRKIELRVIGDTIEEKRATYDLLSDLNNRVFRAANKIVTSQVGIFTSQQNKSIKINYEIKNLRTQLRKEKDKSKHEAINVIIKEKESERKLLQEKAKSDLEELLGCSQENSTYRLIANDFEEGCSYVLASLNNQIYGNLTKEINDVICGNKSLRTYRKGMPIPFTKQAMVFEHSQGNIIMHWLKNSKFKMHFGRDSSNNESVVQKCMEGKYKISNSSIQHELGLKGKTFLLLAVNIGEERVVKGLDKNVCVGVDLGVAVPACVAVTNATLYTKDNFFGSKDDFLRIRQRFRSIKRQKQKSMIVTNGGRGRGHKLRALDMIGNKEYNWVTSYNHKLTAHIIKFAISNGAGTIKMEFLKGYGKDGTKNFILSNWSYYQVQQMLEYKTKLSGIDVFYIDPYDTSNICSCCGHKDNENRESQSIFKCKNTKCKKFDKEINADYNAALNISRSTKFVTKEEDCQFYKNFRKKEAVAL